MSEFLVNLCDVLFCVRKGKKVSLSHRGIEVLLDVCPFWECFHQKIMSK